MSENAPGGPMHDRYGGVRRVWYDPLGWAGMNKISPPNKRIARTKQRQHAIKARRKAKEIGLAEKNNELRNLELEARAMEERPHLQKQYARHTERMRQLEEEIRAEKAQIAEDRALQGALKRYADRMTRGHRGNARTHLQNAQAPDQQVRMRFRRLAETWSAVSIGLALFAFVGIALFSPSYWLLGALIILSVFIVLEATFQGRLLRLANLLSSMLALIAGGVLIVEFFKPLMIGLVLLIGGYLLYDNLREIWS